MEIMKKLFSEEISKNKDKKMSSEKAYKIWKEKKDEDLKCKIERIKKQIENNEKETNKSTEESEKAYLLW